MLKKKKEKAKDEAEAEEKGEEKAVVLAKAEAMGAARVDLPFRQVALLELLMENLSASVITIRPSNAVRRIVLLMFVGAVLESIQFMHALANGLLHRAERRREEEFDYFPQKRKVPLQACMINNYLQHCPFHWALPLR